MVVREEDGDIIVSKDICSLVLFNCSSTGRSLVFLFLMMMGELLLAVEGIGMMMELISRLTKGRDRFLILL
jgi:hypothetical protein